MANFDTGIKFVTDYLIAKEKFLDGSEPRKWFAEGAASYKDLVAKFDWKSDDGQAMALHEQTKDAENTLPPHQERKYRLRTLFQAAGTSAVRQQFTCGPDNKPRGPEHTFRYELSNMKAVRCCLSKFNKVQERMDKK